MTKSEEELRVEMTAKMTGKGYKKSNAILDFFIPSVLPSIIPVFGDTGDGEKAASSGVLTQKLPTPKEESTFSAPPTMIIQTDDNGILKVNPEDVDCGAGKIQVRSPNGILSCQPCADGKASIFTTKLVGGKKQWTCVSRCPEGEEKWDSHQPFPESSSSAKNRKLGSSS